jgi:hypothetical protein
MKRFTTALLGLSLVASTTISALNAETIKNGDNLSKRVDKRVLKKRVVKKERVKSFRGAVQKSIKSGTQEAKSSFMEDSTFGDPYDYGFGMEMYQKGFYGEFDYYLQQEGVEFTVDEKGNLTNLKLEDDYYNIEATASYDEQDRLIYGKVTEDEYWAEESMEYGDEVVTSTFKDVSGFEVITKFPVAVAPNMISKYDQNGNPTLAQVYQGSELMFSVEMRYDESGELSYNKMTMPDHWVEMRVTENSDGTTTESFSGSRTYTKNSDEVMYESRDYTETVDENGNSIYREVGVDSGTVYYEDIYSQDGSYCKSTMVVNGETYWYESTTEVDEESGITTVTTIDSMGVETVEKYPKDMKDGGYYIDEYFGEYGETDSDGAYEKIEIGTDSIYYDYEKGGAYGESVNTSITGEEPPFPPLDAGVLESYVANSTVTITESHIESLPTGWNLIGSSFPTPLDALKNTDYVFTFDAESQTWQYAMFKEGEQIDGDLLNSVDALKGFWIKK